MIKIENLTKSYGDKLVLDHLTMSFPECGAIRIMGESGIGKTTLLNIIMGLDKDFEGTCEVSGSISACFQEDRLLDGISALENVKLGWNGSAERDPAKILSEMGLADDVDVRSEKLSGGMARRTAIARALARDADIYIMDEPVKGLDQQTAGKVLEVIRNYTQGKLLIVVTHSPEEFMDAEETYNLNGL